MQTYYLRVLTKYFSSCVNTGLFQGRFLGAKAPLGITSVSKSVHKSPKSLKIAVSTYLQRISEEISNEVMGVTEMSSDDINGHKVTSDVIQ